MSEMTLSDLNVQQLSELLTVLNFTKLKTILLDNEYSGAMLNEVSSVEELQSIDNRIKPLEAKGWFKEVLKLKESLPSCMIAHHECPVCMRLYSEVNPTTLLCGHSLCVSDAMSLRKCPICKEEIQDGFRYAVSYTIKDTAHALFPSPKTVAKG